MTDRDTIIGVLKEIASDKKMLNRADYWALICGEAADLLEADASALMKEREPKQIRCEDCEYCYTEGFVHERLVCEKHPEIDITDDWFCADYWKA